MNDPLIENFWLRPCPTYMNCKYDFMWSSYEKSPSSGGFRQVLRKEVKNIYSSLVAKYCRIIIVHVH